jgi:transcription elongation factor Elf1
MNQLSDIKDKFLNFTCMACGHLKEYFCVIVYQDETLVCCRECYKGQPMALRTTMDYFVPNWFRLTDKGKELLERLTN